MLKEILYKNKALVGMLFFVLLIASQYFPALKSVIVVAVYFHVLAIRPFKHRYFLYDVAFLLWISIPWVLDYMYDQGYYSVYLNPWYGVESIS